MGHIVADTSALVSLGVVADATPNPLDLLLDSHTIVLPKQVIEELRETAAYDDPAGEAAHAVLDRQSSFEIRSGELDETFPLEMVRTRRSRSRTTSTRSNCSVMSSINWHWCMRRWLKHASSRRRSCLLHSFVLALSIPRQQRRCWTR